MPRPAVAIILLLFGAAVPAVAAPPASIEFLGEVRLAPGQVVDGAPLGGLSGVAYDRGRDRFLALTDDPSSRAASRLFVLRIDVADGRLQPADVAVERAIVLTGADGQAFPELALDGEGLARRADGGLWISSEGNIAGGFAPWIARFDAAGRLVETLRLPRRYRPRGGRRGVRHNLAFEGLTLTPNGRWLLAATENALVQDGPAADVGVESPVRISRWDAGSGRLVAEYLYRVDALTAAPVPADGHRVSGLVEILAAGDDELLALERSWAEGVGTGVRLYRVDLAGATDVRRVRRLARSRRPIAAAEKTLLVDFAELGVEVDNVEGLAFGPALADGRRTLVAVSDDNFSASQVTQVLAFALDEAPVTPAAAQGPGHSSPLAGSWVFGVAGVVTARDAGGFWIESAAGTDDRDPRTSEGLRIEMPDPAVAPGDRVAVSGRLVERQRPAELGVTTLAAGRVERAGSVGALPPPVAIGPGGRQIPATIDDDGLERFDPADDAIDFFESLEHMRVALAAGATVVGPTSAYGIAVVVPGEVPAERRSAGGGLLVDAGGRHGDRVTIDWRLLPQAPRLTVGDRLAGPLTGVLDYAFAEYRLLAAAAPAVEPRPKRAERTALERRPGAVRVATYNVENLDLGDPEEKFVRLAAHLVDDLAAPEIVALQEVQDDSGAHDDGTVTARATLARLTAAIAAAGGPSYAFRQIDPSDGADGGQPGGNIRVAYLFDPVAVRFVDRGAAGSGDATAVQNRSGRPALSLSPGRVHPRDAAFAASVELGYEPGRKALAAEFEVGGRPLFVVNAHLKSKRGDGRLFGAAQPPLLATAEQRAMQARALRRFVEEILAVDPGAAVIVAGDMNELEFRPPLAVLPGRTLDNLTLRLPAAERYTYVFEGFSQALDHILVSPSLAAGAEIDVVHVNADRPAAERASDHDPVLARLSMPAPEDRERLEFTPQRLAVPGADNPLVPSSTHLLSVEEDP